MRTFIFFPQNWSLDECYDWGSERGISLEIAVNFGLWAHEFNTEDATANWYAYFP